MGPAPSPVTEPATPVAAPSGFLNAGELRDRCLSNVPSVVSYCYAYITGVNDSVKAYEVWLNLKEYCLAADSSQSDLRRVFLKFMMERPEYSSGEAASVVVSALKRTFACPTTP
jgi:hypothetical protein